MRGPRKAGGLKVLGRGWGARGPAAHVILQTPYHAELLVWRPQGKTCVLGAGGDPGGPAPGQGPASEPLPHPVLLWPLAPALAPWPQLPLQAPLGSAHL